MKVIFVRMGKSKLIAAAFILIIFTILIQITLPAGSFLGILIPLGAAAVLFVLAHVYVLPTRKAESLFKNSGINENNITFPSFLNIESGFFEATGEIRSHGEGQSYYVKRKFIPEKKEKKMYLELKEGESFFMAINKNGEGKIRLPGIRVMDKKFKDTLILYAKPKHAISFSRHELAVSHENDHAELRVSPTKNGFMCSLHIYSKLIKARKAKVEIVSMGKPEVKNSILETKDSRDFEYRFLDETIVVVSPYGILSPRFFLHKLSIDKVIAGYGNFFIRLSLDLPFKKDVFDVMECTIKLEEKV